ncbi:MAG: SusC/RagA family TonB-linked outer membrane protein [Prevotella sp.]|nr:SusC/RagA family TonB-linked outer membrane protein [Prevotella sp.]MCH3995048.1 SusC/RagA family TonB-linked outer membrane protein [Prevotella sp.]
MEFSIDKQTIQISKTSSETLDHTICGKVVDENGDPLPGVMIRIGGNIMSTQTDDMGNFLLKTSDSKKTYKAVLSFIGKRKMTRILKVGKKQVITMEDDVNTIPEVVLTGYQTIDKRLMSSATTTVKMDDIKIPNVNSLDKMLQGAIPGVMVQNVSGSPNATPKIRVRGTSTIFGNASPLWVVDGVIHDDPVNFSNNVLNDIIAGSGSDMSDQVNLNASRSLLGNAISGVNPNDIETITFLKDASATAIYGTQAANGVIVITTKKGKMGKPSVNFSSSIGFTSRPDYSQFNLMNSKQRIQVSKEVVQNGYLYSSVPYDTGYEGALFDLYDKKINFDQFNDEVAKYETMNTDWLKLLCQNALNQDYSASISGGSQNIRYYNSLGYTNSKGTTKGDNSTRYTLTSNLDASLSNSLKISTKLNFSNQDNDGFYTTNPYTYALQTSRTVSPDEYYTTQVNQIAGLSGNYPLKYNIFNELQHTGNKAKVREFNGSIGLNYNIMTGLKLETLAALAYSNSLNYQWADERSYYIVQIRGYDYGSVPAGGEEEKSSRLPHGGTLNYNETNNTTYDGRIQLSYSKIFGKKGEHVVNAMGGYEIRSAQYSGFNDVEWGYFPDRGLNISYEYDTGTSGSVNPSSNSSLQKHTAARTETRNNTISGYATLVYAYKNRYILNGNIRADASNRFGQYTNHKVLPVWSVSGRWKVNDEKWLRNWTFLNDLSLRASYGLQGNIPTNVGPNLIVKYISPTINRFSGNYQLGISRLPYPNLRWEKTASTNLGMDFSLLNGRIGGTIDYYLRKGKDIIFNLPVASEYGTTTTYRNGANLKNTGLEISMDFVAIRSKDLTWTISPNYSKNTNNITNTSQQSYTYLDYLAGNAYNNGRPVNAVYAWKFTGLDHNTGYAMFDKCSTNQTDVTLSKDPTTYLKYCGSSDPKFNGGLSSSLRFKAFTLMAQFAYSFGSVRRLNNVFDGTMTMPEPQTNLITEMLDRWQKPGDEATTNIPGIVFNGTNGYMIYTPAGLLNSYDMYNYSDQRVVSGDFFRCRNLTLAYTFPLEVIRKLGLTGLTCSINVSNPFTICSSKLQGQDPEVASTGTVALPIVKTYSFSINLNL